MPRKILFAAIAIQVISLVLIVYQTLSTTMFDRLPPLTWGASEALEIAVVLALAVGSTVTLILIRDVMKRNERIEEQLAVAADTFHAFLRKKFVEWQLSDSEAEVAILTIKGFSVAEIAAVRNTSEGTIKAQNSAIYRKSGLSGRVQFISYFLEELTASI
jgi:DNA-binding NarL/FixJ family response regulator